MIHLLFLKKHAETELLPFSVSFQTAKCFSMPHKHATPRTYIHSVLFRVYLQYKKKSHPEAYIDLTLRMTRKENEEVFMLAASVRNVARVSESQLLKKKINF